MDVLKFPLSQNNLPNFEREVFQHGSIGEFIASNLESVESGFIRCIYRAKNDPKHTVTLLCEKLGGCCVDGCCPKDQFWMTGLIILLIFVLIVFCVGAAILIFCYQRSKNRERKECKEIYKYSPESVSEAAIYNDRFSPHQYQQTMHSTKPYESKTRTYF